MTSARDGPKSVARSDSKRRERSTRPTIPHPAEASRTSIAHARERGCKTPSFGVGRRRPAVLRSRSRFTSCSCWMDRPTWPVRRACLRKTRHAQPLSASSLMRLEIFGARDPVLVGDRVVTSSGSVSFPVGLPIGRVVEDAAPISDSLTTTVEPFANPDTLRLVIVLAWPPDPITASEQPVVEEPDETTTTTIQSSTTTTTTESDG